MLFLTELLGAPLPLAGVKFVFQQLADLADQELNDEAEEDDVPAKANIRARRRVVVETPFDDE